MSHKDVRPAGVDFLKALLVPLDPGSLIFIGISSVVLALVAPVGLLALVPVFFLVSWLLQYGYVLLEHVANGGSEAPAISVEMLGPFQARAWIQAFLVVCVYSVMPALGRNASIALGVAVLVVLPASIGVLGVSGNLIEAVNPKALWRTVCNMQLYYLWVLAVIAAFALATVEILRLHLWSALQFAWLELAILSIFSGIGGAIHVRRLELGFEPRVSPERVNEKAEAERLRQRQRLLDEVFQLVHARQSQRADGPLTAWLAQADPSRLADDARAIRQAALNWHNEQGVTTVLQILLGSLVAAERHTVVMETLLEVLDKKPEFTLTSELHTLRLAQWAVSDGRPRLALKILTRYERLFPDRALSDEARSLREDLQGRTNARASA